MKTIFAVLIAVLFFPFTGNTKADASQSQIHAPVGSSIEVTDQAAGHVFVRVLKDGIWWIYEYGDDGEIINVYPDEA